MQFLIRWDRETKSGRLAEYLMDPDGFLVDPLVKNATALARELDSKE